MATDVKLRKSHYDNGSLIFRSLAHSMVMRFFFVHIVFRIFTCKPFLWTKNLTEVLSCMNHLRLLWNPFGVVQWISLMIYLFWIWLLVCIAYKMFLISSKWSFPVHLAATPVCSVSEKKKITLKNTVASDIFEMLVHREKSWRAQRTNQLKPSHSTKNGLNISKQTMFPWCHWCLYLWT